MNTKGFSNTSKVKLITISDLWKLMTANEQFILVDTRESADYDLEHIPQSINIPASLFHQKYSQLKPEQKIVLICYAGQISKMAGNFLIDKGFSEVFSVEGGMDAWQFFSEQES